LLWKRAAINGDEGTAASRFCVYVLRHHLFSGAGFSLNKKSGIEPDGLGNPGQQMAHFRVAGDNCSMTRMAPIGIRFSHDHNRAFELGMKITAPTLGSSEAQFASAAFAMLIALLEQGISLKSAVEAILQRLYENPESRPVYDQIIDPRLMEFKLVADEFNDFDWPFGYGWGAVEALSLSLENALSDCSDDEKLIKAISHNGDSAALAVLVSQLIG
jgi:ADP-ribosylglycohydrolase